MIELLILIALQDETCSIYGIKQKIEEQFSMFLNVSFGSVHPALKKMETNKYVSCKYKISPGGQRKLSYSITSEGKKYFKHLMFDDLPQNPYIASQIINIKLMGLPNLSSALHKPIMTSVLIYLEAQKSRITMLMNNYSGKNEKFVKNIMKQQIIKILNDIQWISSLIEV